MEATLPPAPSINQGQLKPVTSATAPFELELRFTAEYEASSELPAPIREAHCLAVQYPAILGPIYEGDIVVGRVQPALVGFSPDEWGACAFGYYHVREDILREISKGNVTDDLRAAVLRMVDFWDHESTAARVRAAYDLRLASALPSDDWMNSPGVAFPLYRLTGGTVDFDRLLRRGLTGLREDIAERRGRKAHSRQTDDLLRGMEMAVDTVSDVCRHYATEARELVTSLTSNDACQQLAQTAVALEHVSEAPPRNLFEAAQLFWLYSLVADIRNYGRLDVTLGPFLAQDLDSGRLTDEDALQIICSLWRLMAARETRVHNRVIIGGRGRPDEASADRFAQFAMEATRTVLEAEPQLSLRWYNGMDPALMIKARDVIAEGRTFPILYNDDVNIPAVQQAFQIGPDLAEQYVPYGCGEYILEHRSFGTPSGVINLLKALEVTISGGVDLTTGEPMGLKTGGLHSFDRFDDLWTAYCAQVEHYVQLLAEQQMLEYRVASEHSPFLLLSLLYDDCLETGRAAFDGGIRYLGGTLETYGNVNAADSLLAIKRLVYDTRTVSGEELLDALRNDFEGHEHLRRRLRDIPKYGNDLDDADDMLLRVHDHICSVTRQQAKTVGLHSYLVVVINNAANSLMGQWTAASADGRKAGYPMNNGNAPSSGNDSAGITAMLNSISKPRCDIHAGAVQNIKFSKQLMTEHRPMVDVLLDTYFANGGAQAMITVVGREELEQALQDPENYRHVFVRVGGFSARFVDLAPNVQMEILNRTLY
jgi:pyruvate-formate lyase